MSNVRHRYQTIEFGDSDIHLRTLRDRQQYDDPEGIADKLGISSATWPLFGIVWDSSKVLAHLMYEFEIQGKRILEVGCGMALSSHVLNSRLADITATDYHPEVENYLEINVVLNKGKPISFLRCDWADENDELGVFDLIIGSDLLYELDHPALLSTFIDEHAKRQCEVIIVDPDRAQQNAFCKKMAAMDFSFTKSKPVNTDYLANPYKGKILRFNRGQN
ncbi:MAG: protein N-lysine methyltransferase family protein [Gammaproteobacteria bacterium]|nr:protein N-lysine methyltransferase family protein [Gammaproteobacteria bacterium]